MQSIENALAFMYEKDTQSKTNHPVKLQVF